MNLAGLIQGMGSPIDDASRQARSFSDLQALHDRQVAAETARQLRARQEAYRQGLTQPVEAPEDLPGGAPAPRAGLPTAPAPAVPAGSFLAPDSIGATEQRRTDAMRSNSRAAGKAAAQQRMTSAEQQRLSDTANLAAIPAAAADVAMLPFTGGYNVLGNAAVGAGNLIRRGANVVAGEAKFAPIPAFENTSITPTYDQYVRGPEQRLAQMRAMQNPTMRTVEPATGTATDMTAPPAAPGAQSAPAQAAAPTPVAPRAAQYDAKKTPFDDLMTQAAQQNGLDPVIFKRLIGSESSFNPQAVSPSGKNAGLGIAQINAVHGMSDEDRLNPQVAIPFAAQLFAQYLREANGDYAEAMMRYKGASSERGRAAMQTPIAEVLSGTQFSAGAQAPAAQATQTAGAPAAAAPAMQFSPEQVTRISNAVQQDLRVKQLQLAEVNRLLQLAPDVQTATQLREQANNIRFGAFQAQLLNASAQALGGDENAVAQLATAARVQYAQTNEGYVAVQQGPDGQFRATGKPMDREQFINALFSEASGAAQKARQAQSEAMAKAYGDIAVENAKGSNALLKVRAEAQAALQRLLAENQLKEGDVKDVQFDPIRGTAYMRTNRNVYVLSPAQDLGGGVMSDPSWVLVQ
jgi:hypothetical protein